MSCCFYLRYPRSAPALLGGALPVRFASKVPTWRLPTDGEVANLVASLDAGLQLCVASRCYLPNVIGRFLPCGVGANHCLLGHSGWGEVRTRAYIPASGNLLGCFSQ